MSQRTPAPTPPVEIGEPVLDVEIIGRLERLGDQAGADFLSQLIVLFLADADVHCADLRHSLAGDAAEDVVRSAHTLRGASANLGATNLALLCTDLEAAGTSRDLTTGRLILDLMETELARVRAALLLLMSTT